MPERKWKRQDWTESVERALGRLVESVTAKRFHPPPLTNEQYRALGREANHDAEARAVFEQYFPELNVAPSDLMDLLAQHSVIRRNCTGTGSDMATFVTMPSKGFRMELGDLVRFLTRTAVKSGCRDTTAQVERLLALSDANQVPGYEVTVFRGLTMVGEVELAEGLDILSYERAAQRSLVRNEPSGPANPMPDYAGMGALVLARSMTWGPCLVPPRTSKDLGLQAPSPAFRCLPGCSAGVIFGLLSIATSHRVQLLSVLHCAPDFVGVNPNFGAGSSTGFLVDNAWTKKDLTPEHVSDLQNLVRAWSRFGTGKRRKLDLALSRLASSIHRRRGRFWLEDRILDTAIALEVMYELESPELSYRLATRAGHLLADTTDERIDISKEMKQFYRLRSSIAHGRRPANAGENARRGFDLALRTLRELLRRGDFPDWERLVMSSSGRVPA